MQVLVTGGAGFIGSHLTAGLIAEGAQVRVLDDLSTGSRDNLSEMAVELVVGDIADFELVRSVVVGCDLVFHQAALVSVPYSIKNPSLTHRTNVTGTFNVFEAARQEGVQRLVYASSSAVYGNLPGLPKREEDRLSPITPYAASKQINEVMAAAYGAAYGVEFIGLRYMNVFGPRQDPSSPYSGVLSIFCEAIDNDQTPTLFGDGEQTRDFIFVEDVVRANLLAAKVGAEKLPPAAVFNVGRGEQTSLNQIVTILRELTSRPFPVNYASERPGDIKHSVADTSQAQTILGFEPEISVIEGLRATLEWFTGKSNKK